MGLIGICLLSASFGTILVKVGLELLRARRWLALSASLEGLINWWPRRKKKRRQRHVQLMAWTRRHGRFFGTLLGAGDGPFGWWWWRRRRNFVSSDPAVLAEVFGRQQFPHFPARNLSTPLPPPHRQHVFVTSGEHWKQLRRKVMLFSGSNIRAMDPLMRAAVHDMIAGIHAEGEGVPFEFRRHSRLLFASLLARLAFVTAHPDSTQMQEDFTGNLVATAVQLLEEREQRIGGEMEMKMEIESNGKWNWSWIGWKRSIFGLAAKSANNQQQEGRNKKIDVFTVLHATIKQQQQMGGQMSGQIDGKPIIVGEEKESQQQLKKTRCVGAQIGQLLLDGSMKAVGFETVSHALACAVHFLAARPSLQARLRAELFQCQQQQFASGRGAEDAEEERETNTASPLLMACLQETLRLCPIVAFASSRLCCSSTRLLSNGVQMRAGNTFEADIFSLGQDPHIWGPDAGEFRPERWLPEFGGPPSAWHSGGWLPFGVGPRKCVGIPLALSLLKMALAQICLNFELRSLEENKLAQPQLVGDSVLWPRSVRICVRQRQAAVFGGRMKSKQRQQQSPIQ